MPEPLIPDLKSPEPTTSLPANENQDEPTPDDDAADLAALIAAIQETKDADTELDADDPAAWNNAHA